MGKCGAGNYVESVVEGPMHHTPSVVVTSPLTASALAYEVLALFSVKNSMSALFRPCSTISEADLS